MPQNFTGTVESGMGKASLFLSLEHYSNYFSQLLGKRAFVGTLNVSVDEKIVLQLREKAASSHRLEEKTIGGRKFGGVSCLRCVVCAQGKMEKIVCLLVFPDKSTREKNVLEVVAGDNLRQKLGLRDGSKVEISVPA